VPEGTSCGLRLLGAATQGVEDERAGEAESASAMAVAAMVRLAW
jgi:hypothetical protein